MLMFLSAPNVLLLRNFAAGYVLSWGDSLWYYPPLHIYGHPFNMADLQGKDFDSHEMVSTAYFTEEVPKPRDSIFFGPCELFELHTWNSPGSA